MMSVHFLIGKSIYLPFMRHSWGRTKVDSDRTKIFIEPIVFQVLD